jgi:hypothetical protein
MRKALSITIATLVAGCSSTSTHRNFVETMPESRICELRFGHWQFFEDSTSYPFPFAIDPTIYFRTSDEEDLQRIVPLIRQLKHTPIAEFIPMCGQLTQIALIDRDSRWVGEVSVNVCSDDISLIDHPLRPKTQLHAYSYQLSLEAFRAMQKHVPDLLEDMVKANPSLSVRFAEAVSNEPNHRGQRKFDPGRARE